MDIDRDDDLVTIAEISVIGALLIGSMVGTYEYTKHKFYASGFGEGRMTERFALHEALVSEIQTTYDQGLNDGIAYGKKKAMEDCDSMPLESGHY